MAEADSDEDLTKELQPLAYHVSDRKRVLREAFRSLKGKRLEAMIPPVLKVWDRPKLESACLAILENLDDETLLAVLDGRASTAGVAAVEQVSEATESIGKTKNHKSKKLKLIGDGFAEATDEEEPKKKKKKKAIAEGAINAKAAKLKKKKKLAKAKLKQKAKKKKKAAAAAAASEETGGVPPHKSLMELLELEFRAKAIKALLRSQGQSVPDIPINLEEDDDDETLKEKMIEASKEEQKRTDVNGKKEAPSIAIKAKAKVSSKAGPSDSSKPKVNVASTSSKPPVTKAKGKDKSTPVPNPEKTKATVDTPAKKSAKQTKSKPISVAKPSSPLKKTAGVVDLINEALSAEDISNQEDNGDDAKSDSTPSSVIANALKCENKSEEDLRLKLLQRYQQKQIQASPSVTPSTPSPSGVLSKRKKRKKKTVIELKEQEEDILDLHPPELGLTDEECSAVHTTENESSEYESVSESEPESDLDKGDTGEKEEETEQKMESQNKEEACSDIGEDDEEQAEEEEASQKSVSLKQGEPEEELDFEEDEEEAKVTLEDSDSIESGKEEDSQTGNLDVDPNQSNEKSEVDEDKLWNDVQEMKEDTEDSVNPNNIDIDEDGGVSKDDIEQEGTEENNQDNEVQSATGMDGSDNEVIDKARPEPETLSDNSRSGVFSETARDDVFESAKFSSSTDADEKITFNTQGQQSLLKRKITFRIDPARIGVLEEQAAEEEAKRAEERKRLEEEERLAREAEEPEEGEIDSDEDGNHDSRDNKFRDKPLEERTSSQSPSLSPVRPLKRRSDEDDDSEDSEESTSYYSRRRKSYKKASSSSASPPPRKRDFGRFSPKKPAPLVPPNPSDEVQQTESPTKKPSSPVEFITQFSDMESISDDDSNDDDQTPKPKKRKGPVQGCASKPNSAPENNDENIKDLNDSEKPSTSTAKETEEEEQEEEEELPKPVTWYERWAQSRGIQKVVKANKIQKKMRSKLKEVKSNTKKKPELPKEPEPSVEAEPIIGSIEEYEKLFGKKVVATGTGSDDNSKSNDDATAEQVPENVEDDDADDLWGDILGGSGSD